MPSLLKKFRKSTAPGSAHDYPARSLSRAKALSLLKKFGTDDENSRAFESHLVGLDNGHHPAIEPRPHVGYAVERAAYQRDKAKLLAEAEGKYVVLVGDSMIGPFDDFPMAIRQGYQQFGFGPLYVKRVLAEEIQATSGTVETSCRS